jgi:nuclear transport factor 2 (NTF2) superfamily protein
MSESVSVIQIPDAAAEPAAYVQALLEVLGDRDPLEVLQTTSHAVDTMISQSDEAILSAKSDSRSWSFHDVLGHLLDVDIVYGFRLRLALSADNPTYPGYDEKGFSRLAKLDVPRLSVAFRWLRTANLELIRSLTPQQLDRRGVHSEQGGEDVRLMVRKLAGHDLAHLEQMRNALASARSQEGVDPATVDSLLRRAERAFAAQDLEAICALFTDDVTARYAGVAAIHGKNALRDHLERRLRKQKGYRPVKTLAVASGNVVVDSWEGEWTDPDSGQHMAGRGIEILKLRGRLVDELDAVFHSWPTSGS